MPREHGALCQRPGLCRVGVLPWAAPREGGRTAWLKGGNEGRGQRSEPQTSQQSSQHHSRHTSLRTPAASALTGKHQPPRHGQQARGQVLLVPQALSGHRGLLCAPVHPGHHLPRTFAQPLSLECPSQLALGSLPCSPSHLSECECTSVTSWPQFLKF